MSSKTLCKMLQGVVIAVAICGLVTCCYILPTIGINIVRDYPEFSHWYFPWLIFLLAASVPCFAILVLLWKTAAAISQEHVFTIKTARLVKIGSLIMFGDVGFFFVGNLIFTLLNMHHWGFILLSLFVDIFGLSLAASAALVSRYLTKAAVLQEEADGTI